jgi:hypothetical protein
MYENILKFLLLIFIFPCALICMDDSGKVPNSKSGLPITEKKTEKDESTRVVPQIIGTATYSIDPLPEKKDIEPLRKKLEGIHIGDDVTFRRDEGLIKQEQTLLNGKPASTLLPILTVDSHKRDSKNILELSNVISSFIAKLQPPFQLSSVPNPFHEWDLKTTRVEDDWLSNEFLPDLLLGYLTDVESQLYSIMPPVDVYSNWWELTSQILQSMNEQLLSNRHGLSTFTISPINFGNLHWAAMVIEQNFEDPSRPTVYFFDSLGSSPVKLGIIETIVKDTQFFKNPRIIDLSAPNLTQKDGKTCGTWMLEAIKAIIQARKERNQGNNLQEFVRRTLTAVNMEAQHNINLVKQSASNKASVAESVKEASETDKPSSKPKQDPIPIQVGLDKLNLMDDVWLGKEGGKLVLYTAVKTAEPGHPNSEGQLNKIIKEVLQGHQRPERLSLRQLHQIVYQNLFSLAKYKSSENNNYAFRYDTNTQRVYSLNFLFLFVVTNEPALLSLVLDKSSPDLTRILDSQGNNIFHIAAYFGNHRMMDIIMRHARKGDQLAPLINARNQDGTNPLGMLFLNTVPYQDQLKSAELIIMEPLFEINRYLNNKRGMDVFALESLKGIGGFNCLHLVLKRKYENIFSLLSKRNSLPLTSESVAVNFRYPAMNPEHHMWHPSKFANLISTIPDGGISQRMRSDYERLTKGIDEGDESGDSDDEATPSWHYKKSLLELSQFIEANQEAKTVTKTPTVTPQAKVDTNLLSSPAKTLLTPEKEAQAAEDLTKIVVVHFHGVPFMQGQLTNSERRAVGRRFIEINREYIENGLQSSARNEKVKSVYTRTTTASRGIENHKMLIDASEEQLDELTRINHLLQDILARFYDSNVLLEQIKEERSSQYKKALKQKYGILSKHGESMFNDLFKEVKDGNFQNIFLFITQKYINSFTSPDLMQFFWKVLEIGLAPISPEIVQYRFPFASTAKSPDHAFKYGMGYNVEEFRGERPVLPQYVTGIPKHRLAGFLYLLMTDLATYRAMENQSQIIDAIQYYKANQLHLKPDIAHQSETAFLGGIDGENVALVIPLVYLNFSERNRALYTRIFDLSAQDWRIGQRLNGSIQQRTSGAATGAHTEQFKLLLKIYLPFAIKLGKTIARLQHKVLHFIDSYGHIQAYLDNTIDDNGTFRTTVQDIIKNQVYAKSPEGRIKTPTKEEKVYHVLKIKPKYKPRKLFDESDDTSQVTQEDEKKHQDLAISLEKPNESEKKKIEVSSDPIDQNSKIESQRKAAENGDETALSELKHLAEQGYPNAQFYLGRLFRKGCKGVKQNDVEAVKCYIKAAEQGHVLAQFYLGFMYKSGQGVQQSDIEAVKWYRKASAQGDEQAKQELQKILGAVPDNI